MMQKPLYALTCTFLITLACQASNTAQAVIPTYDPNSIQTAVVGTAVAAQNQTQTANVPNESPMPTQTLESLLTPAILSTPILEQRAAAVRSCIPDAPPQFGKVENVVDGDTIKVLIDGSIYPVRYIGIDTPESTNTIEYFGQESSSKNSDLVRGMDVILYKDVSETDRYDRLLRYVFVGDMFINYELVNQGYATAMYYPPDVACATLFDEAQANARAQSLGMWAVQAGQPIKAGSSGALEIVNVNKNAEYVDIKNPGAASIDLKGWVLLSETGNQSCKLEGSVQPGATFRIWSGSGATGFSCGYSKSIWNNNETDPAVLFDPQHQEVDRYP